MAYRKDPAHAPRPTLPTSSASGFAALDLAAADEDLLDEPGADGRRPVVLASYPTAIEAELVKSRLEAEGIACDLLDLHTASIGGPLALAVGGVKLRVHEDNAELARDVIAGIGAVAIEDDDEDDDHDEHDDDASALTPARRTPDALASRALRASVVGAVLVPPLGLYSLWLVWRALHTGGELSRKGRIKLGLALGFDALTSLWLLPFL